MLILKYLNPSTAMAKGHMKHPRQGIRSTRPNLTNHAPTPHVPVPVIEAVPIIAPPTIPDLAYPGPAYGAPLSPHVIADDRGNIFCFGAFADKNSGIVYHDLTGSFPSCHLMEAFVSLFSTIMSPTPSLPHPLWDWTTSAYSTLTRDTSKI
jgi:hypothetical protein